jgi:uncharacterized protein
MAITAETKVYDLLETYPYLLDWLVDYAPDFKKLKNPVLYNTVARAATLETAASMADVPVAKFLDDVRTEVAHQEIVAEETAGRAPGSGSGASGPDSADNRARRQEALKGIITKLHEGYSVDAVKAEFDALATEVDSVEIAAMEQALIAEGMPVQEVQRLCDVHVSVFKSALEEQPATSVSEEHPIAAYQRENTRIGEVAADLRTALEALTAAQGDPAAKQRALTDVAAGLTRLAPIELHYLRKENQLFPVLETHGVEGPTKVMWGLDDDIRGRLKAAAMLSGTGDATSLAATLPETLGMIEDMVYKEEKILLPTALQVITAEEWATMAEGDAEIGYAWECGPGGASAAPAAAPVDVTPPADAGPMLLPLPTGALSLAQLDVLFRALPFDVTFVDENDRVRFYSEGDRVFPRSPGAIGREVRNCHPPSSVHKVEQILAEFKAGTKNVAEFWIELSGRFIHIRYFAMRDAEGVYQGCLEVVQDATHVRSLEGQQRLVDW